MKKLLGIFFLMIAATAQAETKATIGGLISSNNTTNLIVSVDHSKEQGPWQYVLEADYFYSEQKNVVSRDRGFFSAKQNYALDERNYIFVVGRYEFDKLRIPEDKVILGSGYGFKLIRTDHTKLSNELSLGSLKDREGWEPVIRNSIWFSYETDSKVVFSNKFLVEQGKNTYIRNKTSLDYLLTDTVTVGLSNLYVDDLDNDNIFTFNIGMRFK
jgi:putative salt-induced outer membrane protein YdiY